MSKNTLKRIGLIATMGVVFQLGGCIADAIGLFFNTLPAALVTELVTDNDMILDVFEDGP